jgi:hypothetical protein
MRHMRHTGVMKNLLLGLALAGCGGTGTDPAASSPALEYRTPTGRGSALPSCTALQAGPLRGAVTIEESADKLEVIVRVGGVPLCQDLFERAAASGLLGGAPLPLDPTSTGASDPMPADGRHDGNSDPMPADGRHDGNSDPMPASGGKS